jgi:hypothetical protein
MIARSSWHPHVPITLPPLTDGVRCPGCGITRADGRLRRVFPRLR